MDKEQVDVIRFQLAQRRFDASSGFPVSGIADPHLGGQKQFLFKVIVFSIIVLHLKLVPRESILS